MSMPQAEAAPVFEVDDDLVKALLADQHPELSGLEIGRFYHEHDHVSVRLGDRLGAWLPLIPGLDEGLRAATPWIERSAGAWSFPASIPLLLGEPTDFYPYSWQIVSWFEASTAGIVPLTDRAGETLGAALLQIHQPAPDDAPRSPTTSRPLAYHADEFAALLEIAAELTGPSGEAVDIDRARVEWDAGAAAPVDIPPHFTHGAISPQSVLSDRGAFAGLCNWSKFGAGDIAADLAAASMVVPGPGIQAGAATYGAVSAASRARVYAYRQLWLLRFVTSEDPFLNRCGWDRAGDQHFVGRPR